MKKNKMIMAPNVYGRIVRMKESQLRQLQVDAGNRFRFKAVVWTSEHEDKKVIVTNMLTGQLASLDHLDMYAVENMDHWWNLCLFVFCHNASSGPYMKSLETRSPVKCNHENLIDSLQDQHLALSETVNSKDIVELAWVASIGYLNSEAAMRQLGKKPSYWKLKSEQ